MGKEGTESVHCAHHRALMICSGYLTHNNLPESLIFKYLALGVAYPDERACNQMYGAGVWAALGLLCISALCCACTGLAFGIEGYVWQLVNCMITACYSLYLRGVMDKVTTMTVSTTKLSEMSMVYCNNAPSLPLLLGPMYWSGERVGLLD